LHMRRTSASAKRVERRRSDLNKAAKTSHLGGRCTKKMYDLQEDYSERMTPAFDAVVE
jgi:hypothetical protein